MTNSRTTHYEPLEKISMVGPIEFSDLGLRIEPLQPDLLSHATAINNLSPHVGTEPLGVDMRAFGRSSSKFKGKLEGLIALHTTQAAVSREVRDDGDESVGRRSVTGRVPVVTVHPVTGKKALFVNLSCTQSIPGFDDEKSDYLLNFLFDRVDREHHFSCRVRYEMGTVVLWYQRATQHCQTLDYPAGKRRHAFRLTPLANVPIPSKVDEGDVGCSFEEDREMLGLCWRETCIQRKLHIL